MMVPQNLPKLQVDRLGIFYNMFDANPYFVAPVAIVDLGNVVVQNLSLCTKSSQDIGVQA